MKSKNTPKSTRTKAKRPPVAKCNSADIGTAEFQVYYSSVNDGEWEHDASFPTQAEAEAYCREQSELYAKDDVLTPWEFYVFEVKPVRAFRYSIKQELITEEE